MDSYFIFVATVLFHTVLSVTLEIKVQVIAQTKCGVLYLKQKKQFCSFTNESLGKQSSNFRSRTVYTAVTLKKQ